MTFDNIIGNPPYQEMTSGGSIDNTEDAMPLYHKFIRMAIKLKPRYISMIIPSRWMCGGKSVLDEFRQEMVESKRIKSITCFDKSLNIFEETQISGGVQYFLWDANHNGDTVIINIGETEKAKRVSLRDISLYKYINSNGKQHYMIPADNLANDIITKVRNFKEDSMDKNVLNRMPFGISTTFRDTSELSDTKNIKVVCGNGKVMYTGIENVTQNLDIINKYKVCVSKVSSEGGSFKGNIYRVLSKPFILSANEICSETFLVVGCFDNIEEAISLKSYIQTKFARFLIFTTLSSMNTTSRNYMFVPIQEDIKANWTDEELYNKYKLTKEEINHIERLIRPPTK